MLWRALAFSKAFQSNVLWNQSTLLWIALVLVKPQTAITQSIILLFSLLFFIMFLLISRILRKKYAAVGLFSDVGIMFEKYCFGKN